MLTVANVRQMVLPASVRLAQLEEVNELLREELQSFHTEVCTSLRKYLLPSCEGRLFPPLLYSIQIMISKEAGALESTNFLNFLNRLSNPQASKQPLSFLSFVQTRYQH